MSGLELTTLTPKKGRTRRQDVFLERLRDTGNITEASNGD